MTRPSPVPDDMLLAAVERAERHRDRVGVPVWLIFEHLAIPRRSRLVRVQIQALVDARALTQTRVHGVVMWAMTPQGQRRLERAERVELPEAPQHLAWRNARALAQEEINRFRGALRSVIEEATTLLDGGGPSDRWFDLAERLRLSARRLGSATYCLVEWVEPNDEVADIDHHVDPGDGLLEPEELERRRALRPGRRNTRLWVDADS